MTLRALQLRSPRQRVRLAHGWLSIRVVQAEAGLDRLKKSEWMCAQFEQIKELAHALGAWSNARGAQGEDGSLLVRSCLPLV